MINPVITRDTFLSYTWHTPERKAVATHLQTRLRSGDDVASVKDAPDRKGDEYAPKRRAAVVQKHGFVAAPDGAQIHYLIVGNGARPLVFLPGAGDALATADRLSHRLVWWLESRAEHFKILYVSRRSPLPPDITMTQQAEDVALVMKELGWPPSLVEAQSAAGPIGVMLGIEHPELVAGLVLSSSAVWLDDDAYTQCSRWLELLEHNQWEAFLAEATELFWQGEIANALKPFQRLLAKIASERPVQRICTILSQLLCLDMRPELELLTIPTLVTGGELDRVFGAELQRDMAAMIPDSTLVIQKGFGHGNDLENPSHINLLAAFARLKKIPVLS